MGILPESVFRPILHGQLLFFSLLCVCLALAATSDEGKSRSLADHIAAILLTFSSKLITLRKGGLFMNKTACLDFRVFYS